PSFSTPVLHTLATPQPPPIDSLLVPIANNRLPALPLALLLLALLPLSGCPRPGFPDVPAGYREFAYVTNGASNTVSVLDLVHLRPDRTLRVGDNPTGISVNPQRNEVYAVNTQSGTITVI